MSGKISSVNSISRGTFVASDIQSITNSKYGDFHVTKTIGTVDDISFGSIKADKLTSVANSENVSFRVREIGILKDSSFTRVDARIIKRLENVEYFSEGSAPGMRIDLASNILKGGFNCKECDFGEITSSIVKVENSRVSIIKSSQLTGTILGNIPLFQERCRVS